MLSVGISTPYLISHFHRKRTTKKNQKLSQQHEMMATGESLKFFGQKG
jgi:hypothetical protein